MTQMKSCPVCGHTSRRVYYVGDTVGIVEDYYACSNCTYFYQMCYSKPIEGVNDKYPKQFEHTVKDLGLHIYPESELENILS